jgi:hypothetical protein
MTASSDHGDFSKIRMAVFPAASKLEIYGQKHVATGLRLLHPTPDGFVQPLRIRGSRRNEIKQIHIFFVCARSDRFMTFGGEHHRG